MAAELYLEIFHGRNTPDENLDDWGFEGPVVGPVYVSWTYGFLKLSDDEGLLVHLPVVEDLINLKEKETGKDAFYGDCGVIAATNTPFLENNKQRIITLEQLMECYEVR